MTDNPNNHTERPSQRKTGGDLGRSSLPETAGEPLHPTAPPADGPAALRTAAFLEAAMDRWGDAVLRLALGQLRSMADAEDVYQDVFLRLLRDRTAFASDDHLKAWLLRVTVNRCRDLMRAGWRSRTDPLSDEHTALSAPPSGLMESDVWEAVGELPADLRTVVHLFYVEGYATGEIARIVDAPAPTVRTRLHRARALLREALGREPQPPALPPQTPARAAADLIARRACAPTNPAAEAAPAPANPAPHRRNAAAPPCAANPASPS